MVRLPMASIKAWENKDEMARPQEVHLMSKSLTYALENMRGTWTLLSFLWKFIFQASISIFHLA